MAEEKVASNGASAWWKWTAAILAALFIGLLPYVWASSQYVTHTDLNAAVSSLEVKIEESRQQVIAAQSSNAVEIAKLQAQIVDLIDRIEQLREDVTP